MQTLSVALSDHRDYPIYIGEKLLTSSLLVKHIRANQVMVVTNETVAPIYLQQLKQSLEGLHVVEVILPDGEAHKNLDTLNAIFDKLLAAKHNRTTTLVALGGGVVGDMTGFAAACYQRGVDFIQVPTTLLAQVDSSVGGKTGVNHSLGKNMIGAFHQPNCVLIDTMVLDSLPDREFSAGLAEVIKYGLICDADFFVWLEDNMEKLLKRDSKALSEAIFRSCENKAKVVAQDERESGIRAILNLGHTFGHAIETAQGYGKWLHGEAVAIGMVMAVRMSVFKGWVDEDVFLRTVDLLKRAALPVEPPLDMDGDSFLERMRVDKKVLDSKLRLVLLKGIGEAIVTTNVSDAEVRQTIAAFK